MSKLELLAPAGNLSTAIVAFESGADSVYAGLPKFNARERSKNFSFEDFENLLQWTRPRGKKVYLTLNTLLKEHELPEVVELLGKVAELKPDAVIVQDLGLLRIIREFFPGLELHGSTQMAIHNSAGVKLAAEMGLSRVILERQVSVEELKIIMKDSPIEIEVFGHGALCCSLSGTCLFSSWLGGWSGNRGRCKQPCRRRFFSEEGNGFFFSTKDLYTLDLINDFEDCNVSAIKIEGRLKGEDYVESTVTAYRKIIDAPRKERFSLLGEARSTLSQSHGRQWSPGFYKNPTAKSVIDHKKIGAAGTFAGAVKSVAHNGFFFKTTRTLRVYDRLRVQPPSGDEGPSFTVTRIKVANRTVDKLRKGEEGFIFLDKDVSAGDSVFIIGRSISERTLPDRKGSSSSGGRKSSVGLNVEVAADSLKVSINEIPDMVYEIDLSLDEAKNRALEPQDIEKEFLKCGGDVVTVESVQAGVTGKLFFLSKEMRKCRQAFNEWLENTIASNKIPSAGAAGMSKFFSFYTSRKPVSPSDILRQLQKRWPSTTVWLKEGRYLPSKGLPKNSVVCRSILENFKGASEVVLPDFCSEKELSKLEALIDEAIDQGIQRFRVTSLYGLELLRKHRKIIVTASYPLPVANSFAFTELLDYGVSRSMIWIELDESAVSDFVDEVDSGLEVYTYGRPTLLTTRVDVSVRGTIRDARGGEFIVDRDNGLSRIFPDKVLKLPEQSGCASFVDLSHADWSEEDESRFNYDNDWL